MRVAFCLVRYPVSKGIVRLMAISGLYARSAAVPRFGMVLGGQSKKRVLRAALSAASGVVTRVGGAMVFAVNWLIK